MVTHPVDTPPGVIPTEAGYRFDLGFFEGPLDLLLFLIQREEINVHDIPISHITEQYLQYLEMMRRYNLELAGEYLVMATTLMTLKAHSLLPKERRDPEVELLREQLVDAILEYRAFRGAGTWFRGHEQMESFHHRHGDTSPSAEMMPTQEVILHATLDELTRALQRVLERERAVRLSRILPEDVRIEDRIDWIRNLIDQKKALPFEALFADDPRRLVVMATFFAMLELSRSQYLRVLQAVEMGPIFVVRKPPEEVNAGQPWGLSA